MRPGETEYAPFYAGYLALVPEPDVLTVLERQADELQALAGRVDGDRELFRYAPGKWSVRQTFGHIVDTERVQGYRAFCIARGETKPLPGFDEKDYVAHGHSDDRPVREIADEFASVRTANLWAIRRWTPESWSRTGTANGKTLSARAIAFIMAGHVRHHVAILKGRYGIPGG